MRPGALPAAPSSWWPRDAGPRDAGPRDAGPRDAGPRDGGHPDGGTVTAVEYTWRDSELRSPPLRAFNAVGSVLRRAGLDRPSLTPDSVIAAAVKEAGSDDFGTDSYREPLDVFTAACRDEAELTT